LAYGSETPLLEHFGERMRQLGLTGDANGDKPVPEGEAQWWLRAYDLYEVDQANPVDERVTDIQVIFDAV
jgi:hypothetical protein